ncbi:putative cytochrome p450 monooxygenase protein [Phaeoacremonium minimum UCRPA7]|uniref:Putative cytochrome p450 monooxygenase protein n=1 Tax=Phaeoacremonium minimum (strain UCR-PA7) TaxID=1286976 RepID=R8BV66_PHAM7|nr:putative cytochrome p450 monooxygenase protein [Phaeoacremonium minimum UCRPA7]EOO03266.1 putative cytochrome p450 monooxygenase protein [Phaeoacremonium minimum UCRPA7]
MAKSSFSGRGYKVWYDVSSKYGPLARIGPNDLLTDDPEIIRRLSATTSQYRRSSWYEPTRIDPYDHSMFSLRDNVAHDKLKGKTAAAYSGKENPALEAEVDYVLAELVDKIRTKYISTPGDLRPLDLAVMAQYFTLDSITKIAFGESFGFLSREEDVYHYLHTIESIAPVAAMTGEIPLLCSIVASPSVLRLAGPKKTDKSGIGKLMAVAADIVSKRFGPDVKDQRDMLGAFVRNGLTQRECETEALFQVVAGSDTTATSVRATLLYTMTTPRVYTALQKEIDAAKISTPITSDEGLRLPYLQAVIYEGIRIWPPFTGLPFKEVPPQGDTINGRFIPGGTRIAPSNWSLMRQKSVFGQDTDVFRPERWLEVTEEQRCEMRHAVELVFGYGRWACAGKPIAFLELNKIFVEKNMWVAVSDRRKSVG